MLLLRLSGQLLLRFAERQFWALLFQLPPRFTRFEPGRSSPLRCGEPRSPQDQNKKIGTVSGARKDRSKKWDCLRRTQRLRALYTIPNRAGGCPNFLRAERKEPKKAGQFPAHAKTWSVVHNPKSRRRLSQFFAGILGKTEKKTVPAYGDCQVPSVVCNPKSRRRLSQFFAGIA